MDITKLQGFTADSAAKLDHLLELAKDGLELAGRVAECYEDNPDGCEACVKLARALREKAIR